MSYKNTSGHGQFAFAPEEIKKWNWGAFFLTLIWGLCNRTYIALLVFVPIVNIFIPFYLGAKGNELAWKNKVWDDTEHLLRVQKKWAVAGWILVTIFIALTIVDIINYNRVNDISNKLSNEVIEIVMDNSETRKLIGDEAQMMREGAINYLKINGKRMPVSHTMSLVGADGPVLITTTIGENYNIKRITILKIGSDKSLTIDLEE